MWVIQRKSNGWYRARVFTGTAYTSLLRLAEKFETKLLAESNCGMDEHPVQVDAVDYFKRG